LSISVEAARRLMMERQGIGPTPSKVGKGDVFDTVDRLGCVQIDTINVVERAHHLTLWSRLGCYEKGLLRELVDDDRLLFEHWAHAASVIPFKDYRYFVHSMRVREAEMPRRLRRWGNTSREMVDHVLERVREEGPLASKDFEHERERPREGWWDWKPAKVALEALFGAGILLVSRRDNFQRYYDLAERVLPGWVDTSEPTDEERTRFFARRTMGCLGLVEPSEIREYYQHWSVKLGKTSKQLKAVLDCLVEEGEADRFRVEGRGQPCYCLPEDSGRMEELEFGDLDFGGVRFHTYFDNLLWLRDRVRDFFGFEPRLEVYTPKAERTYGYYHLPILYGDKLVGRLVPKMNRKRGVLIVRRIWHEPWFEPDEAFDDLFQETLEGFAAFNGAAEIEMLEEKPRKG